MESENLLHPKAIIGALTAMPKHLETYKDGKNKNMMTKEQC